MKKNNLAAVVAGGTGGHVFPACVFADYLVEMGYELDFYTDERGLKYIPKNNNYNIKKLVIKRTFLSGVLNKIVGLFFLKLSCIQAFFNLIIKRPKFVIGFGGYISFPVLIGCVLLGIKITLHEQNAYLGRSNRIFKFFAKYILTSFENTKKSNGHKQILIGTPVRDGFEKPKNKEFLKNGILNILITGGSQGAQIFGDVLPNVFKNYSNQINIVQQAREEQIKDIKDFYNKNNIKAEVSTFIENMNEKLDWADLVICRSGASSVFETMNSGVPAIFVPYMYASDNHQFYNAKSCENMGAALVIEQNNFTSEEVVKFLNKIFSIEGKKMLLSMSDKTKNCFIKNTKQKFKDFIKNELG